MLGGAAVERIGFSRIRGLTTETRLTPPSRARWRRRRLIARGLRLTPRSNAARRDPRPEPAPLPARRHRGRPRRAPQRGQEDGGLPPDRRRKDGDLLPPRGARPPAGPGPRAPRRALEPGQRED